MQDDIIYQNIRDDAYTYGIGKTPLYRYKGTGFSVYAKLEYRNKFHSIKDRAAFFMIGRALRNGTLDKSKIIIEASSGNTGIAIASIARDFGYRAKIYVPNASSEETKSVMRRTGQEVVEVFDEASKRSSINIDSAVALLKEEMARYPGKYVNFDQYSNDTNTNAHFYTTGPEAAQAMPEGFTHVVVSIGTGGTLTGLAKYFKKYSPETRIIGVMPQPYHHIQGLKNLKVSRTPEILTKNMSLIDEWRDIDDISAEKQFKEMIPLGLFVGLSSAANFHSALKVGRENPGSRVLTVFPDSAEKYRANFISRGLLTPEEYDSHAHLLETDPDDCIKLK
jgi:cysteine synthase B